MTPTPPPELAALQRERPERCIACGCLASEPCGGLDGNGLGCLQPQQAEARAIREMFEQAATAREGG